ncbi:nucleoside phosphorylase [Halosquirtibacter xylanolyticus]|uniref:nucleoside phosphorylase n=1 Tax=Halosquirtibacter xylanolyticus TaxID=3374599 RepID=UPI003749D52F|nr:nucleoside phosphorylase [Prolixibacteraceae bacterium]
MKTFKPSELIINPDGTIFHLHLLPGDIAKKILLVGDPGRVRLVASLFENIEFEKENREFVTITGTYKGERFTVLSTGIGTDNIDIVVNELDALANIDFETRTEKVDKTQLTLVRMGTSGALQPNIPVNSFVLSKTSIGFDGLLNFYTAVEKITNIDFENKFMEHTSWNTRLTTPYVVDGSDEIYNKMNSNQTVEGITISAPGFYAPQGRELRIPLLDPELNDKIGAFRYEGRAITNFEMECSAIYGLSKHMGHKAMTICTIIANRVRKEANVNYHGRVKEMIEYTLEHLLD